MLVRPGLKRGFTRDLLPSVERLELLASHSPVAVFSDTLPRQRGRETLKEGVYMRSTKRIGAEFA